MSSGHEDYPDETQMDGQNQKIETGELRTFEDLTLAETIGQLMKAPFVTLRSLFHVAQNTSAVDNSVVMTAPVISTSSKHSPALPAMAQHAISFISQIKSQ